VLTAKQFPFTGPYYGPADRRGPNKGPTAKALKRAMIRMGHLNAPLETLDEHYNMKLESAILQFQRSLAGDVQRTGQYGRGSWEAVRAARVPGGRPHAGEYALDSVAQDLVRDEAKPKADPYVQIRASISDFCERAERNEREWSYTQTRPFSGLGIAPESRHGNDCSSYAILAYYWAGEKTGENIPDPSGYAYKGFGNTWDDLDHHPRVAGSYLVADLAHYDGHVTICRKAGGSQSSIWSSFGQESGPEARSLFYRDDFLYVVRPPLMT
jgi:hypothetical protein